MQYDCSIYTVTVYIDWQAVPETKPLFYVFQYRKYLNELAPRHLDTGKVKGKGLGVAVKITNSSITGLFNSHAPNRSQSL